MQKLISHERDRGKNKIKMEPLSEGIMKLKDKILLCEIMDHTIHSRNYFFRKIKNSIFEDDVLGEKIKFKTEKIKGKIYLNQKEFKKIKNIYSNEKETYFNSINLQDFSEIISKSRSTLYNNLDNTLLTIPDKLLNKHNIPISKIGDEYYISKSDAQSFIDINSNIYLLSDFSGKLFGIDRQCLWKRIKKENKKNYILFEGPESTHKLELQKSETNIFYINKEQYLELEQYIYDRSKKMLEYVSLHEGLKKLNLRFNRNFYKKIKNDEIRFLLGVNLICIKLHKFNSQYFFKKEEFDKLKISYSPHKQYPLSSLISILKSIDYYKKFIKQLYKNKSSDVAVILKFDDIDLSTRAISYKGTHYFSITEIQKIHHFVKGVEEKVKDKVKLTDFLKENQINPRKIKSFIKCDRLCSKTKKISIQLYLINNIYYFNKEEKDKIKKLFN